GNQIVEACKQYGIGVRRRALPDLLEVEELFESPGEDEEEEEDEEADANDERAVGGRRLREEMLGDEARGLSVKEIAKLTGHAESTVYQCLYVPDRRRSLFVKLRTDAELRERALQIVG